VAYAISTIISDCTNCKVFFSFFCRRKSTSILKNETDQSLTRETGMSLQGATEEPSVTTTDIQRHETTVAGHGTATRRFERRNDLTVGIGIRVGGRGRGAATETIAGGLDPDRGPVKKNVAPGHVIVTSSVVPGVKCYRLLFVTKVE